MFSLPVLLATAVSFLSAGSVFFWTRGDAQTKA
jgi:hypothetical protein